VLVVWVTVEGAVGPEFDPELPPPSSPPPPPEMGSRTLNVPSPDPSDFESPPAGADGLGD